MARVAARRRARDRAPRHPPGPLAGRQHRRRRAVGTGGGDLRRGPVPVVGDGARVHRGVRARRHRHDAEALRRQRRRRRARQLSDRSQRAAAARALPAAVRRRGPPGARAVGDDRLQLGGRLAGDAERAAPERHPEARLGIRGVRHLRRVRDRRRDGAAHDRAEHAGRRAARVRGGPRRGLPVVLRPAAPVPGRVPARADRAGDHRRRGRARAAREVRARPVRAALRRRGRGGAIERPRRSSRAGARGGRASIVLLRNERGALPLAKTLASIAVIGADAVEARLGGYSGPGVAGRSRSSTASSRSCRPATTCATRRAGTADARVRHRAVGVPASPETS